MQSPLRVYFHTYIYIHIITCISAILQSGPRVGLPIVSSPEVTDDHVVMVGHLTQVHLFTI